MSVKQIDGYKIRMNECLGNGAYGSVYVGESDKTHKKVAIKVIQKNASTSFTNLSRLGRVPQERPVPRNQDHAVGPQPKHRAVY